MNTLKKLWPYVKFYWHADARFMVMSLFIACMCLALSVVALLVKDWTPVFILLFTLPCALLLFWPARDDADRQRVLPCAEFMLSRTVSRHHLYYARLLLVGLCILPCVIINGAGIILHPDQQFPKYTVSEEKLNAYRQHFPGTTLTVSDNTVRVPRGNLYCTGLMASAGVALLLAAQSFLLLPLKPKFFLYAPMAAWLAYLIGTPMLSRSQPSEAWNPLFIFADWWWLVILSLSAAATLVQWLVCWRLKNLQIT